MSASSVTGLSGVGSAEKSGLKGPGNLRNEFVPQVCPHIVAAGGGTVASGVLTVVFPTALALDSTKYVVIVTGEASCGDFYIGKTDNAITGKMTGFVIHAASNVAVAWMVVTKGYGIDA